MDKDILHSLKDEIDALFDNFDENKDGEITAEEIHRTLAGINMRRTID